MYNRYIRNDNGSYTRLPEEERLSASPPGPGGPPPPEKTAAPLRIMTPPRQGAPAEGRPSAGRAKKQTAGPPTA